jgi:prefoldin subunit 5
MSTFSSNGSDDSGLTIPELVKKIDEYSIFVRDVLQPQLQNAVEAREKVERDIKEYEDLKSQLLVLSKRNFPLEESSMTNRNVANKSLEAMVDLGHKMCYCRAVADDPTTVFIDVGFGFHVEFRLDEALQFIPRRIDHLEKNAFVPKADKARDVATHLKSSLLVIDALSKELQSKRTTVYTKSDSECQAKTISWDSNVV